MDRTLVYVPMLHTEVDLGAATRELRSQRPGDSDPWRERQALLREMWRGIAQRLDEMDLPYTQTRVYQDGLPICGREMDIVQELAERGSLNHRLIAALVQRGATLMGTEDSSLLVGEYQRLQQVKALWHTSNAENLKATQAAAASRGNDPQAAAAQAERLAAEEAHLRRLQAKGAALLEQRDAFIASRIDSTLLSGETAVVFLGLMHRVDELFAGRCDLRLIIHNLPFWSDLTRDLRFS